MDALEKAEKYDGDHRPLAFRYEMPRITGVALATHRRPVISRLENTNVADDRLTRLPADRRESLRRRTADRQIFERIYAWRRESRLYSDQTNLISQQCAPASPNCKII